jgi:hypothetical protein
VDDPSYDPHQIYTRNGHLVMSAAALSSGVKFRLGTPFCLENGFVEVGVVVDAEGGDAPKRIYVRLFELHIPEPRRLISHGSGRACGVL